MTRRYALSLAFWIAAAVAISAAVAIRWNAWNRGPAEAYVWAAKEVRSGTFGPSAYDDDRTSREVQRMTGGRIRDILSPSPPTAPLFVVPFVLLPDRWIDPAWIATNLLLIFAGTWLVMKAVGWPGDRLAPACVALLWLLLSDPLRENVARGQAYVVLFFCTAVTLYGLAFDRTALTGIGLALLLLLKISGWPLWLLLAVRRRWEALVWAAAISGGLVVASLPIIHTATWAHYATTVVPEWLTSPKAMVVAYQTLGGLIQHYLRYDASWNASPVANLPGMAAALVAISSAALMGVTMYVAALHPRSLHPIAAGLVLGVVLSPVAEQYHYLPLFASALVLLRTWLARPHWATALCLVIALLLIGAPLPYKNWPADRPLLAFVAYPRLWGGMLIWCGLIAVSAHTRAPAIATTSLPVLLDHRVHLDPRNSSRARSIG